MARGGATRAAALAQFAEVLTLHEGGGESIDDSDAFLREELGLDPSETTGERSLTRIARELCEQAVLRD